ncbi:MAG: AcrR family transcriptional regulator [Gammaproteobacteria bacterium]|jgi:AcrR family transcriptional regulator
MRPQLGKQKLLDAATILFERQGYFATTIEQIAAQDGVSKGLVYNYFSSKEELLVGLIEAATIQMASVAETLAPSESVEASLSLFLDGYLSFLKVVHARCAGTAPAQTTTSGVGCARESRPGPSRLRNSPLESRIRLGIREYWLAPG